MAGRATGDASATLERPDVEQVAWGPVLLLAGAVTALLVATAGRFGYWGDELYYIAAGRSPSWGYADQPPFVPLLAAAADRLSGGSLVAFRLPSALITGVGVVVAALLAREFGGGRFAQATAAAAYATSPWLIASGHQVSTNTWDAFFWAALTLLLVRWVRTRDDRLLLAIGIGTAVALQVKLTLGAFWLITAVAVLIAGPRELLRRPLLWAGIAVAAVATTPTVLWQAAHGWPQLTTAQATAAEVATEYAGRLGFLPILLVAAGLPAGTALVLYGTWRLVRAPELAPWRFLGWATLGTTAYFVVSSGRFYFVAGLFALLWAAGAVGLERHAARWGRRLVGAGLVVGAVLAVPGAPVYPEAWAGSVPAPFNPFQRHAEEIGWPELAAQVEQVHAGLPPGQRASAVVITEFYRQAGAVERFGSPELARVTYSGSRGYWFLGAPPEGTDTVVHVGGDGAGLERWYTSCAQVGAVDNGRGLANVSQGAPIRVCTAPRASWARTWPEMLTYPVRFNL